MSRTELNFFGTVTRGFNFKRIPVEDAERQVVKGVKWAVYVDKAASA